MEKESKDEIQEIEKNCDEISQIEFTQKLSINSSNENEEDQEQEEEVVVIGTKGPVALRDFPHPRDLCGNFPFDSTPHEMYCSKCYCVSCEVVAPCSQWKGIEENNGHCSISKKCKDKSEINDSSEEKKIMNVNIEPGK